MERLHAIVYGRVQGVSFRYFTNRRAEELRLKGWVRNRSDGSVEMVAEGERPPLEKLLEFLRRGPTGAYVTQVDFEWLEASHQFNRFEIKT